MSIPRFLVGIPTHDRPGLVPEAVRSVLAQTVPSVRVVISDDASAREASAAVQRFVADLGDPRVEYVRHDSPQREYGQGRYLFGRWRGEDFFLILHDDDRLEPTYLETALGRLDDHPELAVFVANPHVFDAEGRPSEEMTAAYRSTHGRPNHVQGPIDVLEPVLRSGFIPISGTVFRSAELRRSGFVHPEIRGNYPFELDLLLRVGASGGRAWFEDRTLLGFRMHAGSLRNGLWYDPSILANLVRVVEEFRFGGATERLRRKFLGFAHRRYARVLMARGEPAAARSQIRAALRVNALSYKSWGFALAAHALPFLTAPLSRAATPHIGAPPAAAVMHRPPASLPRPPRKAHATR